MRTAKGMIWGEGPRIRNNMSLRPELGDDIIMDILSRLPVKSLTMFKCVSQHWHRLICSPHLISLHFSRSKENPIYIICPYISKVMTLYLMDGDGTVLEEITLTGFEDNCFYTVLGSYNGLICCSSDASDPSSNMAEMDIRICNPATREVLLLPKGSPSEIWPSIGVAFGPSINEYKLFRFFKPGKSKYGHHECEIYSSVTRSWRGIGRVMHYPMGPTHPGGPTHVFVNGKVYWFMSTKQDPVIPASVLSVDVEENFRKIDLPDEATEHTFLFELEGCLAVMIAYAEDDECMDVWVLQECEEPVWVKKCSDKLPIEQYECIYSVAARGNEVFITTAEHYLMFNLDDSTWQELYLSDAFQSCYTVAYPFAESLLPCNGI